MEGDRARETSPRLSDVETMWPVRLERTPLWQSEFEVERVEEAGIWRCQEAFRELAMRRRVVIRRMKKLIFHSFDTRMVAPERLS